MVKRKQHIGMFLHSEMGVSWGGMSSMCGCSSTHLQKIFFLRSIDMRAFTALPAVQCLMATKETQRWDCSLCVISAISANSSSSYKPIGPTIKTFRHQTLDLMPLLGAQ